MPRFPATILFSHSPRLALFQTRRSFYSKAAQFCVVDEQGTISSKRVDVWTGDPHEAFVLIPVDISNEIKRWKDMQNKLALADPAETCSLVFHHPTRNFLLDACTPYPRLTIPQDLASRAGTETSSAMLNLFGVTHTVVLDGTHDAVFTEQLKKSLQELDRPLNRLRDI